MTMGSLEKWREYFGKGESNIFGIIENAILVAAADCPNEFKSRRDGIAELLFSCKVSSRCVGCVAGEEGDEGEEGKKTVVESDGDGGDKEEEEEEEEEDGSVVEELLRIRQVLLNKDNESNAVLLEALRKLESMTITVDLLKETEIGKAVTGLRKHHSENIRGLALDLFAEWKEMVELWMKRPKETAVKVVEDWTPESATNRSVVEELEDGGVFPSPPHDIDLYAHDSSGFDLSQILDGLDCDGNLSLGEEPEPKHERGLQTSVRRRPEGSNEANAAGRYNTQNQLVRREKADVRPVKPSATVPRRQPNQSRAPMVPATQRKPLVVAEPKRKLAGPRVDKLKGMDPDEKFEFAKRRLQESYQQHAKAKKQRTIQVLDHIPNQGKPKPKKPLFKRIMRR